MLVLSPVSTQYIHPTLSTCPTRSTNSTCVTCTTYPCYYVFNYAIKTNMETVQWETKLGTKINLHTILLYIPWEIFYPELVTHAELISHYLNQYSTRFRLVVRIHLRLDDLFIVVGSMFRFFETFNCWGLIHKNNTFHTLYVFLTFLHES